LHEVLKHTSGYDEVHYVGYSLGGNVMLKYLGEGKFTIHDNFICGVAISAPVDLPSCVEQILLFRNRLYHNRFLQSLRQKVRDKANKMPGEISASYLEHVHNLVDFDYYYTAPLHGFTSPEDYYTKASSRQFLSGISHPALLLQARDDPMMGERCYPVTEAENSSSFSFLDTRYGGHIAFTQPGSKWHWMEMVALEFICNHSSLTSEK
jgi:predicted alpha/beta-fold hydrolase